MTTWNRGVSEHIPLARRRELDKEADRQYEETLRARRERFEDRNALMQSATKKLFKTEIECKAEERAAANCTNVGITNQHAIKAEQEKMSAIVRAGGKILPAPNRFRQGKTRYGTEPARHVQRRPFG
jgi:hypothetical protein